MTGGGPTLRVRALMIAGATAVAGGLALAGETGFALAVTQCTGTISGTTIQGGVEVPSGASCVLTGDTVTAGVTVDGGGHLDISDSTVDGKVTGLANSRTHLGSGTRILWSATFTGGPSGNIGVACGVTIAGDLTIQALGGPTQPEAATAVQPAEGPCASIDGSLRLLDNARRVGFSAGFVFRGSLVISGNTGAVGLNGDTFGSNATITHNTGGVSLNNDSIGGAVLCSSNNPPPTGSGNTHGGFESPACNGI